MTKLELLSVGVEEGGRGCDMGVFPLLRESRNLTQASLSTFDTMHTHQSRRTSVGDDYHIGVRRLTD